tara:strand:- start:3715 stop:4149 length:435 start_codon:yes stop_codon:yes gene_type:complete
MINIVSKIISYTIAFCSGLFLITYLLKLPHLITKNPKIVDIYYIKNYAKNVPLDYLFVLGYLLIASLIIKICNAKNKVIKILIVGLTTILLTSIFCYYFISKPITSNFFSKWFHTVKYTSVLYDTILLITIYIIYLYLEENTFN